MRAEDLVLQLATKLPQLTDELTSNSEVTSLTRAGTTVTAVTSEAHGLAVNQGVNILGAKTPIAIGSLTRSLSIGTMVTDTDHDITFGVPTIVVITDATEPEFNGEFTIIVVKNRRTITFSMPNSGPTLATGSPLLLNGSSALQEYNGVHSVTTVPSALSFTYEITDSTLFTPASGTILARANARISATASFERVIAAYDEHPELSNWLFIALDDVVASKKRQVLSDATDNTQRSDYFRQQLIQGVSLYFFIPTTNQIAGRQARDLSEDLFRPICQSILFANFDSGLFAGNLNTLQFISHGFEEYNTGFYVHRYSFEQVADLLFEDTVGFSEDVAFRDIDFSMTLDVGTRVDALTADIDLDDEPL